MTKTQSKSRTTRLTKSDHAAIQATISPIPGLLKTPQEWAVEFGGARDRTVASFVAFGRLLTQGKAAMNHGEWLLALDLAQIDVREAEKCMRIANHAVLSNPANFPNLPDARSTLNVLSGLQDDVVTELIADGTVHPRVTCRDLKVAIDGPPEPTKWTVPQLVNDAVMTFFGGNFDDFSDDGTNQVWRRRYEVVTLMSTVTTASNQFHNLLREHPACFLLGKHGIPERALVVFYQGERYDEFVATFGEIGTVVWAHD